MSSVMHIDQISLLQSNDPDSQLSFFKEQFSRLRQAQVAFDSVAIVSSSELTFLSNQCSHELLQYVLNAFPDKPAEIICQGCLGFYASALHFWSQQKADATLFITIDAPHEVHQIGLNTVKLGNLSGQDGMIPKPGIGLFRLQKKALSECTEDAMIIDHVEVIAKTTGIDANAKFIKRIEQKLLGLLQEQDTQMVSFEIGAKIAQLCKMYLQPALVKAGFDGPWLPSFEKDHQHMFSLKQAHELLAYQDKLSLRPLIFPALGVGGRFGFLRITTPRFFRQNRIASPVCIEKDLARFYQESVMVMQPKRAEKAFYKKAQEVMLTIQDEHLVDNLYFRWPLEQTQLNTLTPFNAPAMASIVQEQEQELTELTS